jgi:N-hydroxyarylamine O-acetyltransferase
MTQAQLLQYFERINYIPAEESEEEVFKKVHLQQAFNIPFENLDVYRNRGISLKPDDLFDKLITRRRGGYCFELNAMLAMALRAMGYKVKRVSARLNMGGGFSGHAHCAAIVDAGGSRYIADVGFGGGGFVGALKLKLGTIQEDVGGTYKIIKDDNFGYVVQRLKTANLKAIWPYKILKLLTVILRSAAILRALIPNRGSEK